MKIIRLVVIGILTLTMSESIYGQSGSGHRLDRGEIKQVMDSITLLIARHYYDSAKAKDIVDHISKISIDNSEYEEKETLIKFLTANLQNYTKDSHLYIQGSTSFSQEDKVDWNLLEKEREIKNNYGFVQVQILEGNIGYIRINEFMHPTRSLPTAVAAMKMIENSKALIIDLRENSGGYPGIMEYILNHFFPGEPQLLSKTHYSDGHYITSYSSDLILGRTMVNVPLYILIDKKTASAAEYLAYTLKSFGKATIVGERSAGGANRNEFYNLPYGMRISISVSSPMMVKTNSNWERIGVIPDIESSSPKEMAIAQIKKKFIE